MADTLEILRDGVTLHSMVGELTDPITGRVTGIQQGNGKVYYEGDVIPASQISPLYLEILDDEDHELHESLSKKVKRSSAAVADNLEARLSLPFDGYDDMDEADIVKAMVVLPSSTIRSIQEYEARHGNRERIVSYNIGLGESPIARQEGDVGSPRQDGAEDKTVAKLTTREVPEEGVVTPGDGITGTGDPQIPHGSRSEDEDAPQRGNRQRRGRKPRARASAASDEGNKEGGDSE